MKDFAKKIISAAAALTMAVSMSVYAEETVPVESVNNSAPTVINEDSMNRVVGCVNHVTFRTDEYLVNRTLVGTHVFDGKTCYLWVETYQYELICMKCNATVKTINRTADVHSVSHP